MTDTQLRATRRTLVRGAAWSVPVVSIAAAAPAFAASCDTQSYLLDWGVTSFSPGPTTGATRVATASVGGTTGGGAMTATFSSTTTGTVSRADDNLTLSSETNVGGLNLGRGLNISHDAPITAGFGNRQTVAISFNRDVTGLSFWITDIDSTRDNIGSMWNPVYSGWYDRVALSGTYNQTRDANVLGSGTTGAPWYYNDDDTNVGNQSTGARVKVTYTGTIAANTAISLEYWTTLGGGNQRIFLSDMSWTSKGC